MNRFGIATITSDGNTTLEMYHALEQNVQDGQSGLHYVRSPYSFIGVVYFKPKQTVAPAKNGNISDSKNRIYIPVSSYALLHGSQLLGNVMDIFGWKTASGFVPSNQPCHNNAPSPPSSCNGSLLDLASSLHNGSGRPLYTIMTVGNQVNSTRMGQTPSPLLNVAPCDHINDWKRLRGKHGQGQYSCLRCGSKWRTAHSYHSLLASLNEK